MNNIERFWEIFQEIKRDGIENLAGWLRSSDFFTCPASTKYHGAEPGGLLNHSLNVYEECVRLLAAYPEIRVPRESVIIASLFHDLCKVNFYTSEKRNRKDANGKWESYDAYTINEKFCYGGHGSKSVFIVQSFIDLTPEEAVAINCHMSCWDGNTNVGNAYEQFPFAWILHCADEAATYIKESKNKGAV